MINKLIIDESNIELNDKSKVPYSYTFAQANTHVVRYGIDNTDEICAYAFEGCTELSYIAFPPEIKNIKRGAFKNCTSLERVPLSANIKYIGKEVFDGCTSLREIDFEHNDPPTAYCTFPSQTILYVPNGQKYVEVAYEQMNLDGTVQYFTKNAYSNKYERVYDVTFATEDGTYFRNKWDKLGDDAHVVEEKNRYPVTDIEFTPSANIKVGETFNLSYTLSPENVTNTQLYWYSTFSGFTVDTDTGVEGMVKVKATTDSSRVGSTGKIIAYAESGVSFSSSFTLTRSDSSTPDEPSTPVDTTVYVEEIKIDSVKIGDKIVISGNIDSVTVPVGNPIDFDWTVLPATATNNSVSLTSESENIVVTAENTIEAITVPGNYDIKITANDGSRVSKTVTLKVVAE